MRRRYKVASQLPYAQRLQIQRRAEIAAEREDSAQRMMSAIMEALHDNEGYGYTRLNRYAVHVMDLIREFYADREIKEEHLRRRLKSLGIELEKYIVYAPASNRKVDVLQAEAQDAAMVAMLVALVAANDVAGLGADRIDRLCKRTSDILDECAEDADKRREHREKMERMGGIVENGKLYVLERGT